MSAAVSITPFVGADGSPMTDVSEFSQVLNWIGEANFLTQSNNTFLIATVIQRS